MTAIDALLIVLAGVGAGTINGVVGSGTLITFPTLVLMGYPALTANISNTLGLVAGGFTASLGYRREAAQVSGLLRRYLPLSILGGAAGGLLLLVLPPAAFRAIVPALIVLALILVIAGPRLQRAAAARHERSGGHPAWHAVAMAIGVFAGGMYGGYFGAAQGVLLMGLFSLLSSEPIQQLNALKTVLTTVVNVVSALVFLVFAREHISWPVVGLIAVGAAVGGYVGARIGRRLPPAVLRGVIVLVGTIALIRLVTTS